MIMLLMSEPLQVRDLIPGDIYLKAPILYASGSDEFDDYQAIIDDRPKLVRVFRVQADQKERVMQVGYFPPLFIRILTLPSDFKKTRSKASLEVCCYVQVLSLQGLF